MTTSNWRRPLFWHHVPTGLDYEQLTVCLTRVQFTTVYRYKLYTYMYMEVTDTFWGWSGGAMVLCKLPVPGRPANLD